MTTFTGVDAHARSPWQDATGAAIRAAHLNEQAARRLRLAEVSSGLGAGVLGLGLGVLLAEYLQGLGPAFLIAGLLLHAWGMADKHRLETKQGAPRVWWSTLLYWFCWVTLAVLTAYVVTFRL